MTQQQTIRTRVLREFIDRWGGATDLSDKWKSLKVGVPLDRAHAEKLRRHDVLDGVVESIAGDNSDIRLALGHAKAAIS